MRSAILVACLLSLLPLAALGHDLYMAYGRDSELNFSNPFHLSQIGWLWETYMYDNYRSIRSGFTPETWQTWMHPVLRQTALGVTMWPPLVIFTVVLVLKVMRSGFVALRMGGGGAAQGGGAKGGYAFRDGEQKKAPLKYKRK